MPGTKSAEGESSPAKRRPRRRLALVGAVVVIGCLGLLLVGAFYVGSRNGILGDETCEVTAQGLANRAQMYGGDTSRLPESERYLQPGDRYDADSGSGCIEDDLSLE